MSTQKLKPSIANHDADWRLGAPRRCVWVVLPVLGHITGQHDASKGRAACRRGKPHHIALNLCAPWLGPPRLRSPAYPPRCSQLQETELSLPGTSRGRPQRSWQQRHQGLHLPPPEPHRQAQLAPPAYTVGIVTQQTARGCISVHQAHLSRQTHQSKGSIKSGCAHSELVPALDRTRSR